MSGRSGSLEPGVGKYRTSLDKQGKSNFSDYELRPHMGATKFNGGRENKILSTVKDT